MDSNNKGVERWQDIQKKYEHSQGIVTKQITMIEELNEQIQKLKDVNSQVEYSWNNKYTDDMKRKDDEMRMQEMRLQKQIETISLANKDEVKNLKQTFRDDVIIIDQELNKQVALKKQAVAQCEKQRVHI